MHVTLRPTIALFLKEFDSYDFWTKKNTCNIPHWLVCFKLMDSDVHDVTTALVQRYIEAAQRLTRGRIQIRQNYKGE